MSEAKARFLRGTTFELFDYATVRRCELNLVDWYEGLLDRALPNLCLENEPVIQQIVNLPGDICGCEDLKLRSATAARDSAQKTAPQLTPPPTTRMATE